MKNTTTNIYSAVALISAVDSSFFFRHFSGCNPLGKNPSFRGISTTYCLDTQKHHPDYWQLRGMPGKETASVGNGAQEVEPQHGVPGHSTGSGGNGKPVYTEEKVPERYVIGCSGDMEEANRRFVLLNKRQCSSRLWHA